MYTDEDLDRAVKEGIFSDEAVGDFRLQVLSFAATPSVDEEHFKLISGFNDIFVVIACVLLLVSSAWVTYGVHPSFSMGVVAALSWGLAEFFVLRRRMSFPAIVLLISFVYATFFAFFRLFEHMSEISLMVSAVVTAAAAWLHWKRFNVPITVAAGVATVVVFIAALLNYLIPAIAGYYLYVLFLAGVTIFALAMQWDGADRARVTRKSDVAFWLHLLAAPLIVHPIFSSLGILENSVNILGIATIIILYICLSTISLVIDRRAFMVSSLMYVLYALSSLFQTYGMAGNSFAIAGVLIGFSLLLLSGYWPKARDQVLKLLPDVIQAKVPGMAAQN